MESKKGLKGFSSKAVHAGESRKKFADTLITPIVQTATFVFENTADIIEFTSEQKERFEYARYGNPTERSAELKLAALEGAEDALLFSSGMNAIVTVLLAMLNKDHHIIVIGECYKRTIEFCNTIRDKFGIGLSTVKTNDFEGLEHSITKDTRIIFAESPTNPHLDVLDIERVVDIARGSGIKVIMDSTLATPFNQRSLEFGVDLVVHSATKYLAGHNDILGGVVAGSNLLVSAIKEFRGLTGGVADPHSAYLLIRGLKTLSLRMERHNSSAMKIAQFLEKHPKVKRVYYPGLPSHPDYEIAKRQMSGYGGMLSFEIDGDLEKTCKFLDSLTIPYIAPSLGGVESLVTHPALMTYHELSPEERAQINMKDELVRLAVGIEDADDLLDDLDRSLKAL